MSDSNAGSAGYRGTGSAGYRGAGSAGYRGAESAGYRGAITYLVRTPDGTVAEGQCEFVVVPTTSGELGVMRDHAALVATVADGEMRVTSGGSVRRFAVAGGLVDVRDNEVRVLVSRAARVAAEDGPAPAAQA